MSFTATPLDGSSTPIPMSSVVPDGTNTPVALEGGPSLTTGGNTLAPVSMYVKDGNNVAQGTTTDAAWSGSGAGTEIALLKKLVAQLAATLTVSISNANNNGQALMANSAPVVIASDQTPVPIKSVGVALAPWSSQPTQTAAAGANTQLKFGSAGNVSPNHLSLQNNTSSVTFYYSFDVDSTGSTNQVYTLAAGQSAFWDRSFSVLHCHSASQVAFGGSTGFTVEAFS